MGRSSWVRVLLAVVVALALPAGLSSAAGSQDLPPRPPPPTDLRVDQDGRAITLSWSAVADPRVAYYTVVLVDGDSQFTEHTVPAGPSPRITLDDLPIWEGSRWSVSARQDHLLGSEPSWGEPFVPMAKVILDDAGPLQEVEGTAFSEGEERKVWFSLDHPMPVDVWVKPYAVEQRTVGDDDSDEAVHLDEQFPTAAGDRVEIRAGQTRAFFVIRHWPDQWRRYVRSRTVLALESSTPGWNHEGTREVGAVDVDGVRLVHVLLEDDRYRWPEVVGLDSRVRAGQVARVPVRLRTPARRSTTLRYRTVARSARPGRDFRVRRGSVTVARDARTAWVRVPTLDRRIPGRREFAVRVLRADKQLARVTQRSRTIVRIAR